MQMPIFCVEWKEEEATSERMVKNKTLSFPRSEIFLALPSFPPFLPPSLPHSAAARTSWASVQKWVCMAFHEYRDGAWHMSKAPKALAAKMGAIEF